MERRRANAQSHRSTFSNCNSRCAPKSPSDPGRKRRQPKSCRRGPRVALHFTDAPRDKRHHRAERKNFQVTGLAWMDHEFFTASTRKRTSRLGLVQRATRRQHRTHALSHSAQRRFSRSVLRSDLR